MIELITILFCILSAIYFFILFLVAFGLSRLKYSSQDISEDISVVIAARNEENRIRPTLESLEALEYPQENYEIIFVDDASTDHTADIIESYTKKNSHWHLIRLKQKSSVLKGKKSALKEAINKARGSIIFTTDADCRVPSQWLKIMSSYFGNKTSMVLGHSPIVSKKGLWYKILEFDNLFSAILGAAPAKLGFPLTSVGRNLAYRKSDYREIGGFDALKKFRSGDDVHLTERFRKNSSGKIEYCVHPDTFVWTMPPSTNREIFHQQIRKNSKVLNKSIPSVLFSLMVFLIFLTFILLPIFHPASFSLWLKIILIKQILEFGILTYATLIFRKKKLIPIIPLLQLVYPVYIIFFSALGILQIYEWKN